MLYVYSFIGSSPATTSHQEQPSMLDHMTFRVTDIARAKAFYSAALAPWVTASSSRATMA
jgi:predicted enzyme related to lactoylglutathione lyase